MTALTTVVVGGGISGLEAARWCARRGDSVTLIEASGAVGGKLASGVVDGLRLDVGAESLLARRPEGVELIAAAQRTLDLVHPATSGAGVWLDRLYPLPRQQLLGIPTAVDDPDLAHLLGAVAMDRLRQGTPAAAETDGPSDMTVAELVGGRLGPDVVERLVEPLLGGVYAGRADQISVDMAVPGLLDAVHRMGSVVSAAASLRSSSAAGPVFASVAGGLGSLPTSIVDVGGFRVLTNAMAVEVASRGGAGGWTVALDNAESLPADCVVVAVPGFAAATLLGSVAPEAAAVAADLEYASVALVTAVFDAKAVTALPSGTGFLVPPMTKRLTKAATFASRKWGWVHDQAPDREVLRFSVGRHGDARGLDLADAELVDVVLDEVRELLGIAADPRAAVVTRWQRSLPQYRVGHRARVRLAREALPAGIAVAGAAWDGVGIPACIASGRQAADRVGRVNADG